MIIEYTLIRNNGLPELFKIREIDEYNVYSNNEYIVNILNKYFLMNKLDNEENIVISMDSNFSINGIMILSKGTSTTTKNNRRALAIFLALTGAEQFSIIHNHPTHDLSLNENDKLSMEYDQYLGSLMEIKLHADMIISQYGWRDLLSDEGYESDEADYN